MSESIAPARPADVERDNRPYVVTRPTLILHTIGQIADRIPLLAWLAQHGLSANEALFLRHHDRWLVSQARQHGWSFLLLLDVDPRR